MPDEWISRDAAIEQLCRELDLSVGEAQTRLGKAVRAGKVRGQRRLVDQWVPTPPKAGLEALLFPNTRYNRADLDKLIARRAAKAALKKPARGSTPHRNPTTQQRVHDAAVTLLADGKIEMGHGSKTRLANELQRSFPTYPVETLCRYASAAHTAWKETQTKKQD